MLTTLSTFMEHCNNVEGVVSNEIIVQWVVWSFLYGNLFLEVFVFQMYVSMLIGKRFLYRN